MLHRHYGEFWKQRRRDDFMVTRDTVARHMDVMGLRGVVRGRRIKTTMPAGAENGPEDLVQRDVRAGASICRLHALLKSGM